MKHKFTRAIVAVVSTAALVLTGTGIATAGGGTGATSTTSAAAKVDGLRTQLQQRADAGDVEGTRVTLGQLDPLLAEIAAGRRYSVPDAAQESAASAKYASAEAAKGLDALAGQPAAARQQPPDAGKLKELLQQLFQRLSELIDELLGNQQQPTQQPAQQPGSTQPNGQPGGEGELPPLPAA